MSETLEMLNELTGKAPGSPYSQLLTLTKRELFAALILNGICSKPATLAATETLTGVSVHLADALIAELAKGPP